MSEDKLPDRCKIFSSLNNEGISERDYLRAIDVWNVFEMNTMGDYHDFNLKTCFVISSFWKMYHTCLEYYELDPCHYFSSPGLGWDAMLKMTGIELELISDIDMHLFIEKGIRGAISYIAKWCSKANNKYMQSYDEKRNKYITYLSANDLCGWAVSQYLSYHGSKWLN